ncbi:MAG: DAK2 domain-containing protein, partial [Alphaproteobacteria bacterium]
MADFDNERFFGMFHALAEVMEEKRDHLCALDGEIGDGDHGIAMALSFAAIRDALADLDRSASDAASIFNTAAKAFLNAVGGSTGPLYATAFMRAGALLKGKSPVGEEDVAGVIGAMAKGITDRGKASPGDKTMLDAW